MALIAVHTVVHISPADARVIESGRVIVPMATSALEERVGRGGATQGILVAGDADAPGIAVIDIKPRMSKRRPHPACGGVACPA